MKNLRNPVAVMDSVEALDLLGRAYRFMRDSECADKSLLAAMREQFFRHERALRKVIGKEDVWPPA